MNIPPMESEDAAVAAAEKRMREEAMRFAKRGNPKKIRDIFYDDQRKPGINKSGLVPYQIKDGKLSFYLMMPEPKREDGNPGFQIGKGTREILINGKWTEYKPDKPEHQRIAREMPQALESHYVNALREAIEEVGLDTDNIEGVEKVHDWGIVDFESQKPGGGKKSMWLFLAEVTDADNFRETDPVRAKTQDRRWFTLGDPETDALIRPDHLKILQQIERELPVYLEKQKALQQRISQPPAGAGQGKQL